jgi:hypothetical protein
MNSLLGNAATRRKRFVIHGASTRRNAPLLSRGATRSRPGVHTGLAVLGELGLNLGACLRAGRAVPSYNPLKSFTSKRSRAEAQAEYVASRDAVTAITAEDSGAAYLAAHKPATDASSSRASREHPVR